MAVLLDEKWSRCVFATSSLKWLRLRKRNVPYLVTMVTKEITSSYASVCHQQPYLFSFLLVVFMFSVNAGIA